MLWNVKHLCLHHVMRMTTLFLKRVILRLDLKSNVLWLFEYSFSLINILCLTLTLLSLKDSLQRHARPKVDNIEHFLKPGLDEEREGQQILPRKS